MSVNRKSDLDTSLSRTDGVHHKYLNLSSAHRDRTLHPDSADCELSFDDQSNVIGMKILNLEIPHTKYAIDKTSNNLYMSEKWGEEEYHFYSLRTCTGGHSVQNLGASLTLASKCPVMFTGDRDMANTYAFHTSALFGKVGVVSSGDRDYTVHSVTETVTLVSMINSDTEATVSYLAPFDQVFMPGALLVFKPHTYADRDVQVVEIVSTSTSAHTSRLIGDFSDLDSNSLDFSLSRLVPYSGVNSVSKLMGFGSSDLHGQTAFEILSIGSPFSVNDTQGDASVMVTTNFTPFLSSGDFVRLSGIPGFMDHMVCEVAVVHDETHAEIVVDRSLLWSHESGQLAKASDPDSRWSVVGDINLSSVSNNSVELAVTLDDPPFSPDDRVVFFGFLSPEFEDLVASVVDVNAEQGTVTVQFDYPSTFLFDDGRSSLSPVNPVTGIPTTCMSPDRFDLSRGRRMVLCRAVVDNQDVGSIHIPSLSSQSFFGRIQLFSGGDLVNFLASDTAVGSHEFNSVLKRLNKIRLQFFNEDGSPYDFVGVDFTMFLQLTCLDSNKGL